MEKSRQRAAYPKIIDRPELKSPSRCLLEGSITMLFLAVFVYWIVPAVTALLWYLCVDFFCSEMAIKDSLAGFARIMRDGGFIVLVIINYKIIDKPELKSPFRYLIEGSITLFLWSLWVYWISPILTALLWFLGFKLFKGEIISQAGFVELTGTLKIGGLLVLMIAFLMLSWVYYNYLWFLKRGERRNKRVLICFDQDIAKIFNVDPILLKKIKKQNRIEVYLENNVLNFKKNTGIN